MEVKHISTHDLEKKSNKHLNIQASVVSYDELVSAVVAREKLQPGSFCIKNIGIQTYALNPF